MSKEPRSKSDAATDKPTKKRDVVLVGDRVSERGGYRVLRQRDERMEIGELRELAQGRPLSGEIVRLHPTEEHERLFDCEVLHDARPEGEKADKNGPAMVASPAYRKNWDSIFKSRRKKSQLN
jgi:hypothetical protein